MKHVKLFEQFANEVKDSFTPEFVDKLQKIAQEYLKLCLDYEKLYLDVDNERNVLKSQIMSAYANGNDQEAKKLEKQKEALSLKRAKIDSAELKMVKFKVDAKKDPEIKKIVKDVGDIFAETEKLAKAQAEVNQTPEYLAALKKIDQTNLNANDQDRINHYIKIAETLDKGYKKDLESASKNLNDIFAKLKEF